MKGYLKVLLGTLVVYMALNTGVLYEAKFVPFANNRNPLNDKFFNEMTSNPEILREDIYETALKGFAMNPELIANYFKNLPEGKNVNFTLNYSSAIDSNVELTIDVDKSLYNYLVSVRLSEGSTNYESKLEILPNGDYMYENIEIQDEITRKLKAHDITFEGARIKVNSEETAEFNLSEIPQLVTHIANELQIDINEINDAYVQLGECTYSNESEEAISSDRNLSFRSSSNLEIELEDYDGFKYDPENQLLRFKLQKIAGFGAIELNEQTQPLVDELFEACGIDQ